MIWLSYVGIVLVVLGGIVVAVSNLQSMEYQQTLVENQQIIEENAKRVEECYATATGFDYAMCGYGAAQTSANLSNVQDNSYQTLVLGVIIISSGITLSSISYIRPSWFERSSSVIH